MDKVGAQSHMLTSSLSTGTAILAVDLRALLLSEPPSVSSPSHFPLMPRRDVHGRASYCGFQAILRRGKFTPTGEGRDVPRSPRISGRVVPGGCELRRPVCQIRQ